MKNLLILLAILFSSFVNFGQDYSVEWKSTAERNINTPKLTVINTSSDGNEFVVLRESVIISSSSINLDKYSFSGGLISSTKIPDYEETDEGKLIYKKTLVGTDGFLVFYHGWKKDTKTSSWLVRNCNMNGEFTKEAKLLDSHIAQNQLKTGNYDIATSPDFSKFVVFLTSPFEKGTKEKVRIKVFNTSDLEEKWSKDITMDIESERGSNIEIAMDNNENIYVVKRIAEGNYYKFHLYTANSNSTSLNELAMEIPEKTVLNNYQLLMTPQGNLFFTGLYSEKTSLVVDGSFCIKINTSNQQIESTKFNLFTDRISGERADIGQTDIVFKEILLLPNGGYYILAEKQKEKIEYKADASGKMVYEGDYSSNKIIVMCYKSDGKINWEATINKDQNFKSKTKDPGQRWDSYTAGFVGEDLYIFYNKIDLGMSWKEPNGATFSKGNFSVSRNYPFIYVLEPNGNIKFGDRLYGLPLFELFKGITIPGASIMPKFSVSTNNGLIIMASDIDGKKVQFGKFILN